MLIYTFVMLSFRQWMETYGSTGAMTPEKQDPTKFLPGAFNVASPPESSQRPETAGPENGKKRGLMRKRMKRK